MQEGSHQNSIDFSTMPLVWVIVLNWNGYTDTLSCIQSIDTLTYPRYKLLIIDNDSTDNSVQQLSSARPDVPVIQSGNNLGYGAGNNIGIKIALESGADYVWVLNNDTRVDPDALSLMVQTAEATPRIGAVGSVIFRSSKKDDIQAWGGGKILPWLGVAKECRSKQDAQSIDYITGASILLKRGALKDVGIFDENFFMYWEDVDLGIRLRNAGWQLTVADEAAIIHKHAASMGKENPKLIAYYNKSARYFFSKHGKVPAVPIVVGTSGRLLKQLKKLDFCGALAIFG